MPNVTKHLYGFTTDNGWSGFVWNYVMKSGKEVVVPVEDMKNYLSDYYGTDGVEVGPDIQAYGWTTDSPSSWEDTILRPGQVTEYFTDYGWWDGRLSIEEDNYEEDGYHSGRQPRIM